MKEDLEELGIKLLVNERTIVETRLGKVEVIGTDFYKKNNGALTRIHIKNPRQNDTIARLWLVHNPFIFRYIKDGECDICFR